MGPNASDRSDIESFHSKSSGTRNLRDASNSRETLRWVHVSPSLTFLTVFNHVSGTSIGETSPYFHQPPTPIHIPGNEASTVPIPCGQALLMVLQAPRRSTYSGSNPFDKHRMQNTLSRPPASVLHLPNRHPGFGSTSMMHHRPIPVKKCKAVPHYATSIQCRDSTFLQRPAFNSSPQTASA